MRRPRLRLEFRGPDNGRISAGRANNMIRHQKACGMAEQTLAGIEAEVAANGARHLHRVYIIDDDSDVRKSLHFLLASSSITAWPFSAAADFLDQLPDLAPAPILLDIRMAEIDGLQLLAILQERAVSWPVIIMTAHGDVAVAVRAMKLGAIEFIEKPFGPGLLDHALNQAFGILETNEQALRSRDHARQMFGQLSRRESQVVGILMRGVPNKLVAHQLNLSVRTVEMHRANALSKLEVKSIAEVMALAASADITAQSVSQLGELG